MGVYGRTSLNAQVEPWRWATETERHDRFQSRQTNTRNRSYHSLRITKVGNRRLAKRFSSYYFQCLLLNPDGRNNIYLKEHQSKDRSHLEWTVHADDDGGTMVWAIFSWHTLEPLVQKKDRLNAIPLVVWLTTCCSFLSMKPPSSGYRRASLGCGGNRDTNTERATTRSTIAGRHNDRTDPNFERVPPENRRIYAKNLANSESKRLPNMLLEVISERILAICIHTMRVL